MNWDLCEAMEYYRRQGAPGDQTALVSLLREVQQESGGTLATAVLLQIAEYLRIKESYLLAIVKRIPGLRLSDRHLLQLCAGPNCGKCTALAAEAEKLCAENPGTFDLQFTPCMRMCGKGPNIKWDGTVYHRADAILLQRLLGK